MAAGDDTFISDEEEEYCPLCVEEMDISDKNFKPCPCGYQICQFCYNNIRQNPELNGRCPACRRLYDDESVEYKTITPDEYKMQQLKREKRDREKKQKEKERKENELASKKHLAGLRVVQKNLVYVTGLNPPCPSEDLHAVLRSDKYFGQYGKIQKIVVNKKTPNPSNTHHHQSPGLAVYVTFARKEDASKCISELDGSLCDGRVLRAAHGTTKYCSSYLRGHPCPNPNCMFLHEPGEEADSYTRKDLSTQQGIKMGIMGLSGPRSNGNLSNTPNSSAGGNEPDISEDEDSNNGSLQTAGVLPATAQWGRTGSSTNSPAPSNNTSLNNSAAFPSLSEILREQKHKGKDLKLKKTGRLSKDGIAISDESDMEDDSVIKFVDETTGMLKSLTEKGDKLKTYFKHMEVSPDSRAPSLFAFNPKAKYADINKNDEKQLTRQVIERFLLRPLKNYHLAYQNHPILQQKALLQQQAQLQRQQQAQSTQLAQLQQLQVNQKRMLAQQASKGSSNATGANPSLQQQQQLLLLQQLQSQSPQLQQQQLHQDNQLPYGNQNQSISMLRVKDRGNTATPPPPGLFSVDSVTNNAASRNPSIPLNSQNNVPPQSQTNASPENPSSSAQLLTQLMSGKR